MRSSLPWGYPPDYISDINHRRQRCGEQVYKEALRVQGEESVANLHSIPDETIQEDGIGVLVASA